MNQEPEFKPEVELEDKLHQPLSGDVQQLRELDASRLAIELKLAEARRVLSYKKAQYLAPSMKGQTELDRRVKLKGVVRDFQYHVDYYEAIIKVLDAKLELGRALIHSE